MANRTANTNQYRNNILALGAVKAMPLLIIRIIVSVMLLCMGVLVIIPYSKGNVKRYGISGTAA